MMLWVDVIWYGLVAALEALAYAFMSGADQSLLYELMQNDNDEDRYLQVSSRLMAAQSVISGVAIALGALIAEFSWTALFELTVLICITQFSIARSVRLKEVRLSRSGPREGMGSGVLSEARKMSESIVTSAGPSFWCLGCSMACMADSTHLTN